MSAAKNQTIVVLDESVRIQRVNDDDYICLTDIARHQDSERTDDLIRNWIRNRNTIEFLGIWERLNNPGFKPVEFDGFRKQAGLNSFTMTPFQWIDKTGAIRSTSSNAEFNTFAARSVCPSPFFLAAID